MDGKEGIVHSNEAAIELDTDDETQPILSKEDNFVDKGLSNDAHLPTDSYGTFYPGPKTVTLSQRRVIRRTQRMLFKELQSGLTRRDQVSTKFTKCIGDSMKRMKEIQRNHFRIWGSSIKHIQGHLGSGVCTYFKVIVWLLKINLLCMVLALAFIVGPGSYMANCNYAHHPSEESLYNKDDLECTNPSFVNGTGFHHDAVNSVLQLLTGTGWMESTAMFYGWYPTSNLTRHVGGKEKTLYNFSLAYFTVGISYFFLSLLFMLYNLSKLFNKSAAEQFDTKPYSSKVFTCDYGVTDTVACEQQSVRFIQSLKEGMTEDAQEDVKREFSTKVGIFFLRILTNITCLGAMVGTVYLYVNQILTDSSEFQSTDNCGKLTQPLDDGLDIDLGNLTNIEIKENLSAFWSTYSASIIVSGSNVILPMFFELVGTFEMYSFQSTRIGITLLRMFIMKLFNISVYLYILYIAVGPSGGQLEDWQTPGNTLIYNCWENYVASQLYQLVMVDFIVFCIALLCTEALRSYLVTNISFLRDRLGITKKEFNIAEEILDLVHKQMIFWSGFYFAPLFPVVAVLEVIAIFYLKKISALRNVIPPKTVVLNHQSTFAVNCLFLISLFIVFVFMGLVIFNFHPSTTCGAFRGSVWFSDPFSHVIENSGKFKSYIVDSLKTTSVFIILVIVICLVIYYYRSLASSRKVTIGLLRQQVKDEIADKKFLLDRVKVQDSNNKENETKIEDVKKSTHEKRKELQRKISRAHSFAS